MTLSKPPRVRHFEFGRILAILQVLMISLAGHMLAEWPAGTSIGPVQGMRVPVSFEANRGQASPSVRFISRGIGATLQISDTEVVMVANDTRGESIKPGPVVMRFLGAHRPKRVTGVGQLRAVTNYYVGSDPSRWVTDIPQFSRVRIEEMYRGIDVEYYNNKGFLEYDLIIRQNADPNQIRLGFEGGTHGLRIDSDGSVLTDTEHGSIRLRTPLVHQEVNHKQVSVEAKYFVDAQNAVHLALRDYDSRNAVLVDPVLEYSAFINLGGAYFRSAVAADGSIWFAYQSSAGMVIQQLDSSSSQLKLTTVIGGSQHFAPFGVGVYPSSIALSKSGLNVTGITDLQDFPIRGGFQSKPGGGDDDGFVLRVSPAGTLLFSSYLGGSAKPPSSLGQDHPTAIAVDSSENVYVTGATESQDFPLSSPFQSSMSGFGAFVSKISPSGSSLIYSTFLGSQLNSAPQYTTSGLAIAVDGNGATYVSGLTGARDFPVANAPSGYSSLHSPQDAFITKLNPSGTSLAYSLFLCGGTATAVSVDSLGSAYVAGKTLGAAFPAYGSSAGYYTPKAFIVKLSPSADRFVYSHTIGGGQAEDLTALVVDSSGSAYVAGTTTSPDFPTVNAIQSTNSSISSNLFRSADGNNWAPANALPNFYPVTAFAVDPTNTKMQYAALGSALFRSSDGGQTWPSSTSGLLDQVVLVHHPTTSGLLFLGLSGLENGGQGGLERIEQFGASRKYLSAGLPGLYNPVSAIQIDSQTPSTIYVSYSSDGVFKSLDTGDTWNPVNTGLTNLRVAALAIDPSQPKILYASTADGIFKTTNGGGAWIGPQAGAPGAVGAASLIVSPLNPATVYYMSGCAVYASGDAGASWRYRGGPPTLCSRVGTLALDAKLPQVLYAGTSGAGVWKSVDGGTSWDRAALPNAVISSLTMDVTNTLAAGTTSASTVFVSKFAGDGSLIWSTFLGTPLLDYPTVYDLQFDPRGRLAVFGNGSQGIPAASPAGGITAGPFMSQIGSETSVCSYSLLSSTQQVAYFGSALNQSILVNAPSGCNWSASSSSNWISIQSAGTQTGVGTILFDVIKNTGQTRTGQITVAGQSVSVTQAGADCKYKLSQGGFAVDVQGGSGGVSLTTQNGCPWTVFSNSSWITVSSPAQGSGSATATWNITANTGGVRSGTVVVAGIPVTVRQSISGRPASSLVSIMSIVDAANFEPIVAPGSWVSILGSNFSSSESVLGPSWITNGRFSTDANIVGAYILINGKRVPISYVGPGQVNFLMPNDDPDLVEDQRVDVTLVATRSPSGFAFTVTGSVVKRRVAPSLFLVRPPYVAARFPDGTLVAPENLIPGVTSRAARPGDTISIYANGLGASTAPFVSAYLATLAAAPLVDPVDVKIGSVTAQVTWAGLSGPGLYQINVVVPEVPNGDQSVSFTVGGVPVQNTGSLPIAH